MLWLSCAAFFEEPRATYRGHAAIHHVIVWRSISQGYSIMRVFLLGATGNSGRRILRFALDRGHEVTALVRDKSKLLRSDR